MDEFQVLAKQQTGQSALAEHSGLADNCLTLYTCTDDSMTSVDQNQANIRPGDCLIADIRDVEYRSSVLIKKAESQIKFQIVAEIIGNHAKRAAAKTDVDRRVGDAEFKQAGVTEPGAGKKRVGIVR
jgi:hypothetical protein